MRTAKTLIRLGRCAQVILLVLSCSYSNIINWENKTNSCFYKWYTSFLFSYGLSILLSLQRTCLMLYSHMNIHEPGHEKTCLMSYANNKGTDQPAHPRSLIIAFVARCLDSVMSLVSVTKISSPMLASVAEQASLSLAWSEAPADMFSHDKAHMYFMTRFFQILFKFLGQPTIIIRNKT